MTSPLLGSLARTVNRALGPTLFDLTYRQLATFQVRAAAAASGAGTITFNSVPSGLAGVEIGDTFKVGATTHTTTNAVAAAAGSIAGVTFTPVLAQSVSTSAVIELKRSAAVTCKGFDEQIDTSQQTGTKVEAGDWRVLVLAESLSVTPKAGDQIVTRDGRTVTVKNVGSDPAKATWTLLAS